MSPQTESAVTLDVITKQLRAEESRLASEQVELQSRSRDLARELRRVRSALAALGVKVEARRSNAASRNRAMSTADVVEGILASLETRAEIPVAQLRALVQERAKLAGRTLIGFHLRFASAIRDQRFEIRDGMCRRTTATNLFGSTSPVITRDDEPSITVSSSVESSSQGSKGVSS
ncbi:MAG: hypothetical protein FLDDKLPJ_03346 [Phycisphaerae bacterium]|nr:hypothetical protein [Phycisphaerae bacterium]